MMAKKLGLCLANRIAIVLSVLFVTVAVNAVSANQTTHEKVTDKKVITNPADIPVVKYNQKLDQLTVKVKSIPLYQVLTSISRQSGIHVLMDASLTFSITARFENQPLLKGFKQLLRRTSSAYYFDDKKINGNPLLLAVKILPKGKQSSNNLKPLVSLPQEAIHQQRKQNVGKGQKRFSLTNERWRARLDRMPEDRRAKLEEMAKKRLDAEAKRKEKQAKYKEKLKAKRMEKRQQRKARRAALEKNLKENHPDQYTEYQKSRAEGRQRAQQGQDERGILTFGR